MFVVTLESKHCGKVMALSVKGPHPTCSLCGSRYHFCDLSCKVFILWNEDHKRRRVGEVSGCA